LHSPHASAAAGRGELGPLPSARRTEPTASAAPARWKTP